MIPFYWNTNVIVIDDDKEILDFLKSVIKTNNNKFHYFYSPIEALKFIKENGNFDLEHLLVEYKENDFSRSGFNVDLTKAFMLADNKNKFNIISLILSDYDMPEMSGINLLNNASDICNAKKILLTGKLSPKEAIEFKGPVFDDYIEKDFKEIFVDKLNNKIDEQINNFFLDLFQPLKALLKSNIEYNILNNQNLFNYFKELLKQNNIREYYVIDYTGTYYLVKNEKEKFLFFVQNNDQLDDSIAEYKEEIGDINILNKLCSKKYQAFKLEDKKVVYPPLEELESNLHPVVKIIDNKYYVSLIKL